MTLNYTKLLFFLIALFPFGAIGQNINVSSFKQLPNDMDARVNHPKSDQNGDKCAIIKVVTTEQGFSWEGDMFGITTVEHKVAEYWLYIPHGSKRLTIKHPQLGVLRDYNYGEPIKEASVYELKLTTDNVQTIIVAANIPTQWVVVDSEPAGVTVYINDELQTQLTPFSKKLETGEYNLRLELADHHTYAEKIILTEDSKLIRNIVLKPAYGSISINTVPESGAIVIIDGKPSNQMTPIVLHKISSGSHNIKLMKDLYDVFETDVIVQDGIMSSIDAKLVPQYSEISIVTEDSAKLYDNGEYLSTGNWIGNLGKGIHQLEARLDYHKSAQITLNVEVGKPEEIELIPNPITGDIDISSHPYGAKIYIDGKQYGTTPHSIENFIIGEHKLVLEKDGFETFNKSFEVKKDILVTLNEELEVKAQKKNEDSSLGMSKGIKNSQKRKLFIALVANDLTPFGLRFGFLGNTSFYIEGRASLNLQNNYDYNYGEDGIIDYEKPGYYELTGEGFFQAYSGIVGINQHITRNIYLFAGLGYGVENYLLKLKNYEYDSPEPISESYAKLESYSYKGIEIDAGLNIKLDHLLIGASGTALNFESFYYTLSIGYCF